MTGSTWLQLAPTSILALGDLTDDLRDTLQEDLAAVRFEIYGGDGTIGSAKASFTYAASKISLAADAVGITGAGHSITIDSADAAFISVPFINTGATLYRIGCRRNFYPSAVTDDTIDGIPVYSQLTEDVGEIAAPDLVTDNGTGLVFRVDTLAKHIWTVGGGASRPCKIWLVDPVTGVLADAVVSGTAVANTGHVTITIVGYLGQDTPSTTPGDYQILMRGPTITTTDLAADANYWLIGTITSGTFTSSAASLFPAYGTWTSTFQVEHDFADGGHTAITADSLTWNTPIPMVIPLGSPSWPGGTGWTEDDYTDGFSNHAITSSASGILAYHSRTATAPNIVAAQAIMPLPAASSGAQTWAIDGWKFLCKRDAAATTLNVKIFEKDLTGVLNDTLLDNWDVPHNAGVLGVVTRTGLALPVQVGFAYLVTVTCKCAVVKTEIEWHNLSLVVTKARGS